MSGKIRVVDSDNFNKRICKIWNGFFNFVFFKFLKCEFCEFDGIKFSIGFFKLIFVVYCCVVERKEFLFIVVFNMMG